MELGLYTFAEVGPGISGAQRMRDLLEEIELADQVGLDVFGVGEHHRPDFAVSAPAVVLAAAAERTRRIRLTSAVTVLSSDDPVRVFQTFATLDLLSGGRAEIMVGRGSFVESFPLFGYDLDDYDELFAEHLDLLLALRDRERVTWSGRHRAALVDAAIHPRPLQEPLPVWIAVGGTPQSVVRAGMLGLPLALAIIGGAPERFAPLVDLYRDAAREAGHDPAALPVGINSHAYVAPTSQQAAEEFFPGYAGMMTRIGRERGWSGMTRPQFDALRAPRGALVVGSPEEVAEKILFQHTSSATGDSSPRSASATSRIATSCGRSSCSAPRSRPSCAPRSSAAPGWRRPSHSQAWNAASRSASSLSAPRSAASSRANGSSVTLPRSRRQVPATAPSDEERGERGRRLDAEQLRPVLLRQHAGAPRVHEQRRVPGGQEAHRRGRPGVGQRPVRDVEQRPVGDVEQLLAVLAAQAAQLQPGRHGTQRGEREAVKLATSLAEAGPKPASARLSSRRLSVGTCPSLAQRSAARRPAGLGV